MFIMKTIRNLIKTKLMHNVRKYPKVSGIVFGISIAAAIIGYFVKEYFINGVVPIRSPFEILVYIFFPICVGLVVYLYASKENLTYFNDSTAESVHGLESKRLKHSFTRGRKSSTEEDNKKKEFGFLCEENINDKKNLWVEIKRLIGFTRDDPNPVFEIEYSGEISYSNPAAKKLFPDLEKLKLYHPIFINLEAIIVKFRKGYKGIIVDEVTVNSKYYERTISNNPEFKHIHLYMTDITELKRVENRLIPLTIAMEETANLVVLINHKGKIEYVNRKFSLVTGYSPEEIIGNHSRMLEFDKFLKNNKIWKVVSLGNTWRGKLYNKKKNGKGFWINAAIIPVRNKGGEITHYLAIEEDTTQLKIEKNKAKKAEKRANELYELATHDGLTGLFNKEHFLAMSENVLRVSMRHKEETCAIMLDIDHFKSVNDSYGHHIGDELIKETAIRIKDNLRRSDIIGRYGGDEFSIILPKSNCDSANTVAEKLRKNIENNILNTEKGGLKTTVSIGIAKFDPHKHNGLSDLLKTADTALYEAKQLGRNQIFVFPEARKV